MVDVHGFSTIDVTMCYDVYVYVRLQGIWEPVSWIPKTLEICNHPRC